MTERPTFTLRPLMPADASRMTEMMRDGGTVRFLQIGGPDYTREVALNFIRSTADESRHLHRAVVDSRDLYQGTVSLKNIDREKLEAEYAISIHPDAQGQGAAAAASRGILDIAFGQLGLKRVYLNVLADNARANKFYQKFGFRFTHTGTIDYKGSQKALNWYEATAPRP
ncbi:MAG: GNAT family N-acetyltransferase [Ruminococcaceae bacterium]|nr:GNAT family N-acetyltransferase [Oscillospiraceae bacterium]